VMMSTSGGAAGLTLTVADTAFIMEPQVRPCMHTCDSCSLGGGHVPQETCSDLHVVLVLCGSGYCCTALIHHAQRQAALAIIAQTHMHTQMHAHTHKISRTYSHAHVLTQMHSHTHTCNSYDLIHRSIQGLRLKQLHASTDWDSSGRLE